MTAQTDCTTRFRVALPLALGALMGGLLGCTNLVIQVGSQTSPTGSSAVTGNWEFKPTAGSGALPFTALSGFLYEDQSGSGAAPVTAVLQSQPTSCYVGASLVPLQGTLSGAALSLFSFSVVGQYLSLDLTTTSDTEHLSGSFKVNSGCANGASGTVLGTRFAPLTGHFSGSIVPDQGQAIVLDLTQDADGSGDGRFAVSGSASISGLSCLPAGALVKQASFVQGSLVQLTLLAGDGSGSQLILSGAFPMDAGSISFSSISGTQACSNASGNAVLTRS